MNDFLESTQKQLEYYKLLGDKAMAQLSDEQLFWQKNAGSNSIATIVRHLSGNMVSRWTDFLTTDGEKETRNREEEFDNDIISRTTLLEKWQAGWSCLFSALEQLTVQDLDKIVYIRNMGHTVVEAIHRGLAHTAYHVGQIVFIGKMMQDDQWVSLSIPRGNSKDYNQEKFAQAPHREHFTQEFLKK